MVDTLQLVKTVVADGNSATMDTGTLTGDLDVLRVVVQIEGGGSGGCRMKFNNDGGNNYRRLFSENGGAKDGHNDGASGNIANMVGRTGRRSYSINTIYNISGKESSGYGNCITDGGNTGSANAPTRMEYAFKWANTAQITSIQIVSDSTNWASGSTLNVYAYSRADEEISDEKTTLTNVPINTRYEETDTKKMYNRKYATGAFDLSWVARGTAGSLTATVWSCADTSAMYAGGTTSAWTANNTTQTWNGSSWSGASNLSASRELLDGGGNATDYISVGGDSGGAGSPQDDVYKWDGSSWSSGGTISSNTFMLSAGGDTTDALWCGGNNGSGAISTAQTYDGSSWTAISSMSDSRRGHLGDGTASDFLAVAGYDDGSSTQRTAIEAWNGTSWSAGTAYNGSNGDMYGYGGGAGRTSSFIAQSNQRSQSNIYTYNGSAWALTNNSTGGSVNYSGVGGDSGNAIKAGGADGSTWAVNTSEKFNGTNWTATNNLNTGISTGGMGGNN